MILLHGIASRSDLPLPFSSVVVGAALVLLITFYVLFFAWKRPKYAEDDATAMPRLTRVVDSLAFRVISRTLVAALWLLAAVALVFGPDRIDNPAVGFTYVWLWVGLVVLAVFTGRSHRFTNPVRALNGFHKASAGDQPGSRLPGAFALLGFLTLELVFPNATTLPVLRAAAALWLLWVVVGHFARPQWIERADPFEVYASTVAPMSPWRRRGGVIHRMNPLRNLASLTPPKDTWAVACVLLGGTAFDAMSNTPWWQRMAQTSSIPHLALPGLGLLGVVALVTALYAGGAKALDEGDGLRSTMNRLSPGLVPLIVGYCFAHYGTYFYLEGQRTAIWFNDPLGSGANWFGFAEAAPNVAVFAFPTFVAWSQVLLIVLGHVVGVLVTHDVALRSPNGRQMRLQLPLLLVMVGFTCAGLLLMFGG